MTFEKLQKRKKLIAWAIHFFIFIPLYLGVLSDLLDTFFGTKTNLTHEGGVLWIFYNNLFWGLLALPIVIFYFKQKEKKITNVNNVKQYDIGGLFKKTLIVFGVLYILSMAVYILASSF